MSLNKLYFVALTFAVAVATTPVRAGELVEFYHKDLDHFFMTGLASEIQALDAGVHKGWARTGQTIRTFDASNLPAGSVPVCRFYGNPLRGLDSHFFSASPTECELVKQRWPNEWLLETDEAFRVHAVDPNTGLCPASTKPVYRLYNKRADINHRYTTDAAVVDAMVLKGYVLEGNGNPQKPVVFCGSSLPPAQPAAGAPICAVTASTSFPGLNTPVTLTATCTESPTSYGWVNCTGTGSTCVVNATVAGTINYSVVATNSKGSSAPASIALSWGGAASAAPSCTVSASNPTPLLGSPVTLTANCAQGPTKYQWLGCSALITEICNPLSECASSTTACSPVGNQLGSVYYAVVASNSAGPSVKAGVNVDWRSAGPTTPPPPPPTPQPSCTITAATTTPAVNTQLVLTANCTNSPTSYQWTNCTSTSATCTTTETQAITRIYRVSGVNATGVGAPFDLHVHWQQPPTSPPVCTLTPSSPTPYVGGLLTLTASCTQAPSSFSWTGCASTTSTCQVTGTAAGDASYSVTASNGFGAGAPASTTVTWGTPPPAGADFCGAYTQVVRVNLPWGGHLDTHQNGGFSADAVLVGQVTVPAGATGTSIPGVVSVVEFIDAQAHRIMSISPSSCDFRGFSPGSFPSIDPNGVNSPLGWGFGINPNIFYSLSTMPGGGVKLEPGRTYYINVRNRDYSTGALSCQTSSCNIRMTLNTPR